MPAVGAKLAVVDLLHMWCELPWLALTVVVRGGSGSEGAAGDEREGLAAGTPQEPARSRGRGGFADSQESARK